MAAFGTYLVILKKGHFKVIAPVDSGVSFSFDEITWMGMNFLGHRQFLFGQSLLATINSSVKEASKIV